MHSLSLISIKLSLYAILILNIVSNYFEFIIIEFTNIGQNRFLSSDREKIVNLTCKCIVDVYRVEFVLLSGDALRG